MRFTSSSIVDRFIDGFDACPWASSAGRYAEPAPILRPQRPLYTSAERRRRNTTPWTLVQGILAPVQFVVFFLSVILVLHYLTSGAGMAAATASIVAKTLCLYAIMVTGAIWEKVVFGRYLFAPAFFWEDAVSMVVVALHTLYLVALASGWLDVQQQMLLALAAYATYVVNAGQFVLKFRAARLDDEGYPSMAGLAS